MKRLQALLGIVLSFFVATNALAEGSGAFSNEAISARSLGQGGVGVAGVNEDLSVLYTNPAALTSLKDTQATLGLVWENTHADFKSDAGNSEKMRSIDSVVPNLAVTQSLMDGKLGVGVGAFLPYGTATHWTGMGPLRYVATNSELDMVDITPSIGYQITPVVSIGVGGDYYNSFNTMQENHLDVDDANTALGSPTTGSPDANTRLSGTGANWGYHAGIQVQPNEHHSFGLAYHSKVKMEIKGDVNITGLSGTVASVFGGPTYTTSAFTDLYIPQNIQFGYAYKPNDKWTFEANTAWYDWFSSRDENIRYNESDPTRLSLLNSGNPAPLSLHDAWSVATGANYKYNESLQLRGGFYYEPSVQPESAFNPDILDLSRYGLTAGFGYAFTPFLKLDFAYNAIFFHDRHINNSINLATAGDSVGKYSEFANVVALNLSYKFGNK